MKSDQFSSANSAIDGKHSQSDDAKPSKISVDYREEPVERWPLPSELELARLAVGLARTEVIDAQKLVEEAWVIYWHSCHRIKSTHRLRREGAKNREMVESMPEEIHYPLKPELPAPKKYPVTFLELERLLLPRLKGRTAERAALFREYFFASLVGWNCKDLSKEPGNTYWNCPAHELDEIRNKDSIKDEVARTYAKWRNTTFDGITFVAFTSKFLRWYNEWNRIRNSEAKALNAMKGWEKRRELAKTKTGAQPNKAALREILMAQAKRAS